MTFTIKINVPAEKWLRKYNREIQKRFASKIRKLQENPDWLVHFLIPGLFKGEHIFTIEPLEAGSVLFAEREIFIGLLIPLFVRWLGTDMRRDFEEMNYVLKVRAEGSWQIFQRFFNKLYLIKSFTKV